MGEDCSRRIFWNKLSIWGSISQLIRLGNRICTVGLVTKDLSKWDISADDFVTAVVNWAALCNNSFDLVDWKATCLPVEASQLLIILLVEQHFAIFCFRLAFMFMKNCHIVQKFLQSPLYLDIYRFTNHKLYKTK